MTASLAADGVDHDPLVIAVLITYQRTQLQIDTNSSKPLSDFRSHP